MAERMVLDTYCCGNNCVVERYALFKQKMEKVEKNLKYAANY